MRRILLSLALTTTLTLPLPASSSESGGIMDTLRFPQVAGSNLSGREYRLPADFEGELNLVFVAFKRDQQRAVNTWLPLANRLAGERDWLAYYELPTIAPLSAINRWFIDSGMRRGIKDPAARAATITLYLEKDEFRRPLGIRDESTIHAFLVDREGGIHWHAQGPRDNDKAEGLLEALDRHLQAETPLPRHTHLWLVASR